MPKYILKSFLAGIFSVTFALPPYAFADAKSPVTEIKTALKELKMENHKDYANFYATLAAKNPNLNPLVLQQLSRTMGSQKFPKIQLQEMKYKGKDALKAIMNINGQSVVVEFLSNGDEILKIDGVLFTAADMTSNEAFTAKAMKVPVFKKGYKDFQKKVFRSPVLPTAKQWARLNPAQRAEYYLKFRQLLEAAYKVHGTKAINITTNKSFDQWVMETMLGDEAEAAGGIKANGNAGGTTPVVTGGQVDANKPAPPAPTGSATVTTTAPAQSRAEKSEEADAIAKAKSLVEVIGADGRNKFIAKDDGSRKGPSCIVAGYAMEWKGLTCPWNGGKGNDAFYTKYPLSKECQKSNGNGWIACNPVVYGFNNSGKAICINSNDKKEFNKATHADGPCEKESKLVTADDKKRFIQNILKRGDIPGGDSLFVNDKGELMTSRASLHKKVMKELAEPLKDYINSASEICLEVTDSNETPKIHKYKDHPKGGSKDPAYQDAACDALMKRAVAVRDLLKVEEPTPAPAPPVIASPCDGWTPADAVEEARIEGGPKACLCKNRQPADASKKMCPPTPEVKPPAPDVKPPSETLVDAAPAERGDKCDQGDWKDRWNPTKGDCHMTGGDWAIGVGGILAFLCVRDMISNKNTLGSFCNSKSNTIAPPKPVDPVPPCTGGAPGCVPPVVPPDEPPPVTPPRSEETTNQNIPIIDQKVVPSVR